MLCYFWCSMGRVLLFAALGCWCAWQETGEACCNLHRMLCLLNQKERDGVVVVAGGTGGH
jgi:hypothetical protein